MYKIIIIDFVLLVFQDQATDQWYLQRRKAALTRGKEKELDDVEKALIERLEQLKKPHEDEAAAFGNHIAARLRTFSPRQYAMACVDIEKILFDIQFPPSQTCSAVPEHTPDN